MGTKGWLGSDQGGLISAPAKTSGVSFRKVLKDVAKGRHSQISAPSIPEGMATLQVLPTAMILKDQVRNPGGHVI